MEVAGRNCGQPFFGNPREDLMAIDELVPVDQLCERTRDFAGDAEAGTAGDLGPEGITFVPAAESSSGEPLLFVTNELSGSTRAIAITGG